MNKQNLSFYGFYGSRTLQGRNPQGAPRKSFRFPIIN